MVLVAEVAGLAEVIAVEVGLLIVQAQEAHALTLAAEALLAEEALVHSVNNTSLYIFEELKYAYICTNGCFSFKY